ncbi:MAG: hypothetical protein ABJM43_04335 [Paracoccaceae bacterium]
MKTILSLFASASLLITTSVASVAEPEKTITIIDLASKYCAAEWTGVIELDTDAWKTLSELSEHNPTPDFWAKHIVQELGSEHTDPEHTDPEHSVPAMDVATTEAFEKYGTALSAISDFVGVSLGFSVTASHFNLASAKFDLIMCLYPTQAELDLIVDFSKTTTGASDAVIRAELFEVFDKLECLQFAEAYKAIFSFESLPSDWEAILDGYMTENDCF